MKTNPINVSPILSGEPPSAAEPSIGLPLDIERNPCPGCFLYETRGVCGAARIAYDLQTPNEIEVRAEALRHAIRHDAHAARGLFERIRLDAERAARAGLPAGQVPALNAPDAVNWELGPEKEVAHVSRALR